MPLPTYVSKNAMHRRNILLSGGAAGSGGATVDGSAEASASSSSAGGLPGQPAAGTEESGDVRPRAVND